MGWGGGGRVKDRRMAGGRGGGRDRRGGGGGGVKRLKRRDFNTQVTQVKQQKTKSPTLTRTWHAYKYKVHKLHQRYIHLRRDGCSFMWH